VSRLFSCPVGTTSVAMLYICLQTNS
jgi:hypothetical protein